MSIPFGKRIQKNPGCVALKQQLEVGTEKTGIFTCRRRRRKHSLVAHFEPARNISWSFQKFRQVIGELGLPLNQDGISRKFGIAANKGHHFYFGLCNQQAIKGIFME